MKLDRMLDRFVLIFVGAVMVTLSYLAWVVHVTGYHWAHLYWIGLGIWGAYVLIHVESVIEECRSKEFTALVNDWVRRGEPDEPLNLKR